MFIVKNKIWDYLIHEKNHMSMIWEYVCQRCRKNYNVCQPERYGGPNICMNCFTPEDRNREIEAYDNCKKEEVQRLVEQTAEAKLLRIPKWIRQLFNAY